MRPEDPDRLPSAPKKLPVEVAVRHILIKYMSAERAVSGKCRLMKGWKSTCSASVCRAFFIIPTIDSSGLASCLFIAPALNSCTLFPPLNLACEEALAARATRPAASSLATWNGQAPIVTVILTLLSVASKSWSAMVCRRFSPNASNSFV